MIASGIHLMHSDVKKLIGAFAEYKTLSETVTHIVEMDKRLSILLDFSKEIFFADNDVAFQNYRRLISEFRKEIELLNILSQIKIEQYPLLKSVVEKVSSHLNELNADFANSSFDSL